MPHHRNLSVLVRLSGFKIIEKLFGCILVCSTRVLCDEFVVAGYLPEYRAYIDVNRTAPYLTDLILFSIEPSEDGNLGPCCIQAHNFDQARKARAYKHENFPDEQPLKIWMSIGGAGRSNAFSKVASDENTRKLFVQNLRAKCQKEQIDGVDIDWEAPQTSDDYRNYILLVEEAHKELLQKHGIMISIALHPRQVMPPPFYNLISRVNLMAYDMITQEGGHHAKMEKMMEAVKILIREGCPKSQVVVGIPAFARHTRNPGQVQTYSEIMDAILRANPNIEQKAATQHSSWKGFLFDAPRMVRQKVHYAMKEGLGGVFIWELGQDKQHDEWGKGGLLLEAASDQTGRSRATAGDGSEL